MSVERPSPDRRVTSSTFQPDYQINNLPEPMNVPRKDYTTGRLYFFDMQSHSHMHYQV